MPDALEGLASLILTPGNPVAGAINLVIAGSFVLGLLSVRAARRAVRDETDALRRVAAAREQLAEDASPAELSRKLHGLKLNPELAVSRCVEMITTDLRLRDPDELDATLIETLESRGARARFLAGLLPLMGLFGTVLGLGLAVAAAQSALSGSTDLTAVAELATALYGTLSGMKTAFSTTLTGILAALVLSALNFRLARAHSRLAVEVRTWFRERVLASSMRGFEPDIADANSAREVIESSLSRWSSLQAEQLAGLRSALADSNTEVAQFARVVNAWRDDRHAELHQMRDTFEGFSQVLAQSSDHDRRDSASTHRLLDEIRSQIQVLGEAIDTTMRAARLQPETPSWQAPESRSEAGRDPPRVSKLPAAATRGVFAESAGLDPVDCTVFAPPTAEAGDDVLVQVFVHSPASAEEVRTTAVEFDPDATRRGQTSLGTRVALGSVLGFSLEIKRLGVRQSRRQIAWTGLPESVEFELGLPDDIRPRSLSCSLTVDQDGCEIGRIRFKVRVLPCGATAAEPLLAATGSAVRYERAFISYARIDRDVVQPMVHMLEAAGIQYFQDLFDLKPGELWKQGLFRHIDECHVMFLFWSSSSARSEWVEREWRHGLHKHGLKFIVPVVIEGPPIPPPPPELEDLNFSEKHVRCA